MPTKRKNKHSKVMLGLVLALLLLSLSSGIGYTAAKYIFQRQQEDVLHAVDFHFSSDYLQYVSGLGAAPEYTVPENAVEFCLYNYELDNLELVTAENISYRIDAGDWTVKVINKDGSEIKANENGEYILPASEQFHKVILTGTGDSVDVEVTSTAPYAKPLQAKFEVSVEKNIDYTVKDLGSYVLVTIHSNQASREITVMWPDGLAPDTLTPGMETWKTEAGVGTLNIEANTTYTLVFPETEPGTYQANPDAVNYVGIVSKN